MFKLFRKCEEPVQKGCQDASYIPKLCELTAKLPILGPQDVSWRWEEQIEYRVQNGRCVGHGLYSGRKVAVQNAFMTYGTVFQKHAHEETEILIVYEGAFEIAYSDGSSEIVREAGSVAIPPGCIHTLTALSDCKMIAVTIPASEIYPQKEVQNEP